MKNKVLQLGLLAGALFFLGSCNKNEEVSLEDNIDQAQVNSQINNLPKETLSTIEKSSLLVMREEEKLARDVYITLFRKWNLKVFNNISNSEQTHTNAVLALLQKYDIADPVGNNEIGVFENEPLQELYDKLVAQGSVSLLEGVKVGATVEDLDIFDLEEYLKVVDNQDIIYVYQNLTKGSRNHLRSFYGQVLSQNGTYEAQFISQSEFDAVINSARETGSW